MRRPPLPNLAVRASFRRNRLGFLQEADQLGQGPDVIGEPCRHCRGLAAEGRVGPAEVVEGEVETHGRGQVLQLLGEGVGQPRESSHPHPHRQVLPLDVAGRNVVGVRVAGDDLGLLAEADGRGVAARPRAAGSGRGREDLDQLGVVNVALECVTDSGQVKVVAVRGQLDTVAQPPCEVAYELDGGVQVAVVNPVGRDELGVGVHRHPRPHVAVAQLALLVGRDVLLLGIAEGPNLVTLDSLAREVAHHSVLVDRADGAHVHKQLGDGVLRDAGHAHGCEDRVALDQAGNHTLSLLGREAIHIDSMHERSGIVKVKTRDERRKTPAKGVWTEQPCSVTMQSEVSGGPGNPLLRPLSFVLRPDQGSFRVSSRRRSSFLHHLRLHGKRPLVLHAREGVSVEPTQLLRQLQITEPRGERVAGISASGTPTAPDELCVELVAVPELFWLLIQDAKDRRLEIGASDGYRGRLYLPISLTFAERLLQPVERRESLLGAVNHPLSGSKLALGLSTHPGEGVIAASHETLHQMGDPSGKLLYIRFGHAGILPDPSGPHHSVSAGDVSQMEPGLPQRAAAAFLAASLRCSGDIFSARAFPPFRPPFRPSATAAGSFAASGSYFGCLPVASSTSCLASSFGSRGRLRDRSGIDKRVTRSRAGQAPGNAGRIPPFWEGSDLAMPSRGPTSPSLARVLPTSRPCRRSCPGGRGYPRVCGFPGPSNRCSGSTSIVETRAMLEDKT